MLKFCSALSICEYLAISDYAGVTADELLFLPVSEGAIPFTDREFMDRML